MRTRIEKTARHTFEIRTVRNSLRTCSRAPRAWVCTTRKVAADTSINYQRVVREMRRNVTVSSRKKRGRCAPCSRIRLLRLDIAGDGRSGETPDSDTGVVPDVGEDTAADGVEPVSICLWIGIGKSAATVVRTAARTLGIYNSRKCTLRVDGGRDLTSRRSVQGVLVRGLEVYAFHYIDFT